MKIVLLEMIAAHPQDRVPSNDKACFTGTLRIFFELSSVELERFHEVVSRNGGRNIIVDGLSFIYNKSNPTYKISILLTAVHAKKLFKTTNRSEVSKQVKARFEKLLIGK